MAQIIIVKQSDFSGQGREMVWQGIQDSLYTQMGDDPRAYDAEEVELTVTTIKDVS